MEEIFRGIIGPMAQRPYRSMTPRTILLIRQIIVGTMIAAFFGMLLTSVWYFTRLDSVTISTITVNGGETIAHTEIEEIVRRELGGSYLKLVPYTFAFSYPHEKVMAKIKENDRINHISVMRSGGTELIVEFEEYLPHALWCKETDSTSCFFIDENGYSFAVAPTLKGGSFLRLASIGKDPSLHTAAFPEVQYHVVGELVKAFAEAKWEVTKVEIDAAGDAYMSIVGGGEFKVSLKQPAKETVDNLLTVLGSEQFAHLTPGNFDYIDLRFGSKVFVNEETIDKGGQGTSTPQASDGAGADAPAPEATPQEEPVAPAPTYASEPPDESTAVTITTDD